jgi:IS30 family transposase
MLSWVSISKHYKQLSQAERQHLVPLWGGGKVSVNLRHRNGRWETVSPVSRKSKEVLNSLTERRSRLLLLTKVDRQNTAETTDASKKLLKKLP